MDRPTLGDVGLRVGANFVVTRALAPTKTRCGELGKLRRAGLRSRTEQSGVIYEAVFVKRAGQSLRGRFFRTCPSPWASLDLSHLSSPRRPNWETDSRASGAPARDRHVHRQ
jgi:hypothetical protein